MRALVDSSGRLGDRHGLWERLQDDGYLLLRGLLPPEPLAELERKTADILFDAGWLATNAERLERACKPGLHLDFFKPDYRAALSRVYLLQALHELPHAEPLVALYRRLFAEAPFLLPKYNVRMVFPAIDSPLDSTTSPHQDALFIQGSARTYTTWIPFHDCPPDNGTLALVPGSHRLGPLPEKLWPPAPAGAATAREFEPEQWATAGFTRGDVLLFHGLTVHRAVRNTSARLRISGSFRFQPASDPISALQLVNDHLTTARVPWEDVYAGFERPFAHRYYWRRFEMTTVPFDDAYARRVDRLALDAGRRGKRIAIPRLVRIVRESRDDATAQEAQALLERLRRS